MRTTLTIDDQLLAELKEQAHREGVPLKQVINRMLRKGLEASRQPPRRRAFRARTYAMGPALVPSVDKAIALAAALEDEEVARELALRK